jgi:hypothetical protein
LKESALGKTFKIVNLPFLGRTANDTSHLTPSPTEPTRFAESLTKAWTLDDVIELLENAVLLEGASISLLWRLDLKGLKESRTLQKPLSGSVTGDLG